ncbi:CRISPR-associated protein Cas2 [Peptoclostridium litorale DSM 5388]|uniref:CRISPR-associated endoribonuclease Cas2 n=1 Tax=Peptoclostridium litorale DSM 5388 TaxID=1121324 RepID=A0A069RHU7_PEPLI|nr:CRISPR-associated endonuclease Cas2 [Peptoclostridium litorale]KDR95715.1 CRISPR-associated endoribonuclease Cas2 [Peptoclostridium litorale DSM 5388]SIO22786.1 CRISPR-associated protein Cas2 [Peptoclostridium litorale DSM 5388]
MYVILVYDIKLDEKGKRVLPKVYKICKKYLIHIQNSVFEGELSKSQIFQLKRELSVHTRDDLDSIIVFSSREKRWLDKEFWALKDDATSNFL